MWEIFSLLLVAVIDINVDSSLFEPEYPFTCCRWNSLALPSFPADPENPENPQSFVQGPL